ncbi:MAG TPA: hypothetical protein VFQ43_22620 [Nitrososphaera sp.]|nr:hypothetical protein [Nitrososphaera sp.]
MADAGDGRSPVYPLLQSEQTDARSDTDQQVRGQAIGADRTDNPATIKRQEGGQEAPMTFKGVLRHALTIVPDSKEWNETLVANTPSHHFRTLANAT